MQTIENKYILTLKVLPKPEQNQNQSENPNFNNPTTQIVSQVELNAEDIVLIKKFIDKCINELMEF